MYYFCLSGLDGQRRSSSFSVQRCRSTGGILFFSFQTPLVLTKRHKVSGFAVPDQDVERTAASGSSSFLPRDPFQLRDGIVPPEEIVNLRRRKRGKRTAKYQLRQNNVCVVRA
jgi:hypothetical protein